MSKTTTSRPSLWIALAAVIVAAAVWATVAMAAGGSASSGASSSPVYAGPHSMFAAAGGSHTAGDCPNMGNDNGGGSSTTPSTPGAPSTPSTQEGSSNPGL
jgi:hypothetical protein